MRSAIPEQKRCVIKGALLGLVTLVGSAGSADAALVRVIYHGETHWDDGGPAHWDYPTPAPKAIDVSFIVDTLSGEQVYTFRDAREMPGGGSGATGLYLETYHALDMVVSDFSVRADGQDIWVSEATTLSLGGEMRAFGGDGGFIIRESGNYFSNSFFGYLGRVSHGEFMATADPVLALLTESWGSGWVNSGFNLSGDWGRGILTSNWTCSDPSATEYCVQVAAIPIPAAAWLFGGALGLLGVMRRKIGN